MLEQKHIDELKAIRADCTEDDPKAIDAIDAVFAELERLQGSHRRLAAMMPLFEEARDALPAISLTAARLHKLDLTLSARMDDVGIPERWAERERNRAAEPTGPCNCSSVPHDDDCPARTQASDESGR